MTHCLGERKAEIIGFGSQGIPSTQFVKSTIKAWSKQIHILKLVRLQGCGYFFRKRGGCFQGEADGLGF